MVVSIVTVVLLLAGTGVAGYVVFGRDDVAGGSRNSPTEEPVDLSTAGTASRSVVTLLNRGDLDGLVAITCATGPAEGRRVLVEAIPALAQPTTPQDEVVFELGTVTEDRPGEAVAELTARYRDESGDHVNQGEILLLDEVNGWRLCGLNMAPFPAPLPGPLRGTRSRSGS